MNEQSIVIVKKQLKFFMGFDYISLSNTEILYNVIRKT